MSARLGERHDRNSSWISSIVPDSATPAGTVHRQPAPDLVRQVLAKAKADGPLPVLKSVRNRLEDQMPLGYSAVGTVVEVGAAAQRMVPGQRVATGGAGHAELQVVSALLAMPVPDEVDDESAAFTTIAAIALQGLRLAELQAGALNGGLPPDDRGAHARPG